MSRAPRHPTRVILSGPIVTRRARCLSDRVGPIVRRVTTSVFVAPATSSGIDLERRRCFRRLLTSPDALVDGGA
jgi:hypothetical protein